MLSSEYIKENLQFLSKSFPETCFRYGYDSEIRTHIIEITPNEHFYKLELLDEAWIPVSIEFMELYPKEEIVFISSDSPLALSSYLFCCNEQIEAKLFSVFFETLLINPVDFSFANSFLLGQGKPDLCITSMNADQANINSKPFEDNNYNFDADQFLMAA